MLNKTLSSTTDLSTRRWEPAWLGPPAAESGSSSARQRVAQRSRRWGAIAAAAALLLAVHSGCNRQEQPQPAAPDEVSEDAGPAAVAPEDPAAVEIESKGITADQLLSNRLDAESAAAGWVRLFDGYTFFGWQRVGDINWRIEDEAFLADEGEVGLMCTALPWKDYELKLQYKADEDTNSGVFLRTPAIDTDPSTNCYELNIAPPDNPFPTGSLVQRVRVEPDSVGTLDPDKWHDLHVRINAGEITATLDGEQILEWTDPDPLDDGFIGLQHNSGEIAFRDIQVRPLGMQSLLDPELEQWVRYPEMAGRFEVQPTEEEGDVDLHVTDGRGQLETKQRWADFVLLTNFTTNAADLNSGIFFRCIPGDEMMGYECQISNAMLDEDPLRPADYGTGGFFRRQNARIVAGEDGQQNSLLLKADGPTMAAWVNGLQVSEWTDTREPDLNPRRGLRLEPGTLMLQAHDPSTDITFHDIRIAPRGEPPTVE